EEEQIAPPPCLRCLEQRVCRQVGNNERGAPVRKRNGGRGDILALRDPCILEQELLVQELAGRIVIDDGKSGAGKTVVVCRDVEQRKPRLGRQLAKITDPDLGGIGGSGHPRKKKSRKKKRAHQPPDQSPFLHRGNRHSLAESSSAPTGFG